MIHVKKHLEIGKKMTKALKKNQPNIDILLAKRDKLKRRYNLSKSKKTKRVLYDEMMENEDRINETTSNIIPTTQS